MQIDILMRVLADEKLTCHYFLNFNFEHKEKKICKSLHHRSNELVWYS